MSRFKTAPIDESTTGSWVERRRKGRMIRKQHTVTGAWTDWEREPVSPFLRTVVDTYNANAKGQSIYSKMTVAELRELAKGRGIKVPSKARKADIISALTETHANN
jgi:hypothetical protein